MNEETTETTPVDNTEVTEEMDEPTTESEETPEVDEQEDGDTFPRSYVERLRRESAGYRDRAQRGDTYAQRLYTELVRATGRLADPTDLAFDEAHLDDPDALVAAVEDLLARKPHLASRRPIGDIGQGASPSAGSVDLAAILRQKAN